MKEGRKDAEHLCCMVLPGINEQKEIIMQLNLQSTFINASMCVET